ncbi:hypothetical protein LINPERPRIM_LOCUS19416 [Linum perenne]
MATQCSYNGSQNPSSPRGVAMVLALVFAVVLSPLYASRRDDHQSRFYHQYYESSWSSGLVLPMVLAGLIIAIRSTSSSKHNEGGMYASSSLVSSDPSWMLRIGGSSWGLAGILVMLMVVLSWQDSVQHFFWR